ncbi:MAG: hypothetical protein ACP5UZ_03515 [Thermoplasmata archaeon]
MESTHKFLNIIKLASFPVVPTNFSSAVHNLHSALFASDRYAES